MAVWLSLSLSQGYPNKTSRTTTVSATLTIHYSGGSYDGTEPSGTITIDGQSFPFVKNFNYAGVGQGAASQGTGSTSVTVTATVPYGDASSRAVYASASFSRASGSVSKSITLTSIGSSGGGSGDGSGDDGDGEEGGSEGAAKSGNVSVIGQKHFSSEGKYQTNTLGGIGSFVGEFTGVAIKFETPYIGGPSTLLNIDIELDENYGYNPIINYAICSSDKNLAMYENASSSVEDAYQIVSGVLNYEILSRNIVSSIQVSSLKTEQTYYLMLWIPSDSDFDKYIQLSYASRYVFNIDYINDGTGDPPSGRLPGNAFPIGHCFVDRDNFFGYYPEMYFEALYSKTSVPYTEVVILKFVTPEFEGVSTSLDVNLYDINASQYLSHICCALCTSDENHAMYLDAGPIVIGDEYQVDCALISKDELDQSSMPFSIQTSKLESKKYYYLIIWVPTDNPMGGSLEIGPAKYHGITVNYIESEKYIYIDNGSDLDKYECYIYDISKYSEYECYIDNGSSWDLIKIIPQ
jgi:hypothetical protein